MDEQEPHVLGELSKYLNGELPGAQRRRVETHLETCESCRRHNEGLLSLRNLLQQTPSLMPQDGFFKKLVLSRGFLKGLIFLGVAALVVWVVRTHHGPATNLPAQKTLAKPAAVSESRPVPVETAAPVTAIPQDSSVQELQQLANTLPPPTTAPAENTVPQVEPVIVPDTAPASTAPPTP